MRYAILLLLIFIYNPISLQANPPAAIWTEDMLKTMTLEEKIGQLFMIAAYSNKTEDYENELEQQIRKYNIGGIIFFQGDPVRQVNLTNRLQKASRYPLMVGMDAEHGIGWRLATAMEFPKMLGNGSLSNDSLLYRLGKTIARQCKEIGVHINFAPVTDINSNPLNPVIGLRSFGENRDNVSRKAIMYMKGSLSEKVMPVAKHFPGHGDTDTDSHFALPTIRQSNDRLDSVELYPYIQMIKAGLPAVMVAHLNVVSLDTSGTPASMSPLIIKELLRKQLGFEGLCFTDALNMKGATQGLEKGEAELKALLAGNDILLFPANIEEAIDRIKQAVKNGVIAEEYIDKICRKILLAKYEYVLPNIRPIKTTALWSRLNSPEDYALKQDLYRYAQTLIKNQNQLIPLKNLDTLRIASLNFGAKTINNFQTTLEKYASIYNTFTDGDLSQDDIKELQKKLSSYNCIIIYNNSASNKSKGNFGYSSQLAELIKQLGNKKIILCHPAIPYGLANYTQLPVEALLISYDDHLYAQQYAAQAIFGGIGINGKLPVSINKQYPAGTGLVTSKTRLGYIIPEMCGISSEKLSGIDSLCEFAIKTGATPGCQVLIAKNGYIFYNKAFGYNTYDRQTANHTSNIYDLASVTKITATLPAVMKLYDEGKLKLNAPLSDYYTSLKQTNKKNITVEEVLLHCAGLKTFIPFLADAIDKKALSGPLFSKIPTTHNRIKVQNRLYFNPDYKFKPETVSNTPQEGYQFINQGLYIYKNYQDTILKSILTSDLNPRKEYAYSDLGFMLLKYAVEEITNTGIDRYCQNTFYRKLGATNTDFMGAERLNKNLIIPSSIDKLYRKTEIKGFVHDPGAAALGGIAGHAGLFSTTEDLAKIMSVYLNKGNYGGEQFFSSETITTFTNKPSAASQNRRGLGFDKPETIPGKASPTCHAAPSSSFGHTGFTGTIAWCDPDNQLIYIFLSNRTYPDEFNTKLSEENIRPKIQDIIYQAIKP